MADDSNKPDRNTSDQKDNGNAPGDEAQPSADPPPTVTPPSGTTAIDEKMEFEVVMLAIAAAQNIAVEIARRVKARTGSARGLVLVGDETVAARLVEWRALAMRIGPLERAMKSLIHTEEAGLEGVLSLTGASTEIGTLAYLLSFFKATPSVQAGRSN